MTRIAVILSFMGFLCTHVFAQHQDQSQSPFFFIENPETSIEQFPLLSTDVHANIIGPMADVTILQRYQNTGTKPIEAKYVFPASTRAAVYSMNMKIGDRTLHAKINTKKKAKAIYEVAKETGQRTSLLEQEMPNVFQMHVANIMPDDVIVVEMKYTEFIIPTNQTYEWVFPTVVGPRFTGEKTKNLFAVPYTKSNIPPKSTLQISVDLNTPIDIEHLECISHSTDQIIQSKRHILLRTQPSAFHAGNKDFIIQFSLSGKKIATGLQVHSIGEEQYFLCQIQPPSKSCNPEIVPREYIFILDVSGSMVGKPLDITKELMRNLLGNLSSEDKYNVLTFAGRAGMLYEQSQLVTNTNLQRTINEIQNIQGGGGTRMLQAIRKALETPKEEGYSRSFIIMTDGYVSVDEEVFKTIQENLGSANFFSLGIGTSVNRNIVEGIAHVGRGEPFIITDFKYANSLAKQLKSYIEAPLLTDIQIRGNDIEIYDVIPEQTPDLMAERPIYFFGKFKTTKNDNASLTIEAKRNCQAFQQTINFNGNKRNTPLLPYLWAREKIRFLDDFNKLNHSEERVQQITDLGLKYSLLTKYTSFVAVDSEIVNRDNPTKLVQTPLPMPAGVSNQAIGMEMTVENITIDGSMETITMDIQVLVNDKTTKTIIETILEQLLMKMSSEQRTLCLRPINRLICQNGTFNRTGHAASDELTQNLIRALKEIGVNTTELSFELTIQHI